MLVDEGPLVDMHAIEMHWEDHAEVRLGFEQFDPRIGVRTAEQNHV